jgi:hypothetical protein
MVSMSERIRRSELAGQNQHARLPSALREPLSRNVQLLMESRVPARLAWNDAAGKPRVAPLWFRWTGRTLELSTFAGSPKLDELHNGDAVAVTIDTEGFPYRSLRIRGPVTIEHVQGLTSSYRKAARRYLGHGPARDWCDRLREADQALLTVHPVEATASEMRGASYLAEPVSAG